MARKAGCRAAAAAATLLLLLAGFWLWRLPAPEEDLDDVELEVTEDGGQVGGRAWAWETADRRLKHEFTEAYKAADDAGPVFARYLPLLGAPALLDFLELSYPYCHAQAHDLGVALYERSRDLGRALGECGTRCTSGCMHGVITGVLGDDSLDAITATMDRLCAKAPLAGSYRPGNCAHGLGHALMLATQHDLGRALDGCDRFAEAGMAYYCATGVFMEYKMDRQARIERGKAAPRPTLHYPCDTFTKFPAACYRYMLRPIRDSLGADRNRLKAECSALRDRLRLGCFHGLGAIYTKAVGKRPALLPDLCDQRNADEQRVCIEGVIEKLADYDEAKAHAACATLTGGAAAICAEAAAGKMYRLAKPSMPLYAPRGQADGDSPTS